MKKKANGNKALHYSWTIENQSRVFKGTGFEDCASCPGCAKAVESDGRMKCSRCGAVPVPITEEQAKQCDGTKPPPYNVRTRGKNKPRVMFRRFGRHNT